MLQIVATPLGHLGDLSPRAASALRDADQVFAEDTRVTQTLLEVTGSRARCTSLHAHNEVARADAVVAALAAGQRCVLVSDAGTPLISDPGAPVVARVVAAGFEVTSVPGPSAVVTALAASGFVCVPFAFFGFLERKGLERTRQIAAIRAFGGTSVIFESKERILATLADLAEQLGDDTPAVLGRELTKQHETYYRGTLGSLGLSLKDATLRGEMTLVVGPRPQVEASNEPLDEVVAELRADATRPITVRAKELVLRCGVTRKQAYDLLL